MSAKDADSYLAKLSADKRATLEKVRRAIRAAAPDAEEGLSYGMPAFIQGKSIAGYSASAGHCSYFPMSGAITAQFEDELAKYEVSKGGFRFPIGKPPPAALIRKLVKARLAEIAKTAPEKKVAAKRAKLADDVDALLDGLEHPRRKEIDAIRKVIGGADKSISEGVKWNAPSFRTQEWFATVNLRSKAELQVVLHLGAKVRAGQKRPVIADPNSLLKWLANDRAMATVSDTPADRKALAAIVRQWIKFV